MREDDRLPRFNRYSIPPRPGTVQCEHCPSWVKPEGVDDHMRAKHPELLLVIEKVPIVSPVYDLDQTSL